MAPSAPQTERSTTVVTIDAIECTALDLRATALTQQEIVNLRWIAFNVDTGSGGTVWPINADYALENISVPAGRIYQTATGEMVEGQTVSCWLSKCLGTPTTNDWRKDVNSQTTESWKKETTRALVGRKRWVHHPQGLTISDSNANVFSKFASNIRG